MPRMPDKTFGYEAPKKRYEVAKTNWLKDGELVKFYNSAKWRKTSKSKRMANPVCEVEGCTQPSYYADHIIPISDGGAKLDWDNLQALCVKCNAAKTSKQRSTKKKY